MLWTFRFALPLVLISQVAMAQGTPPVEIKVDDAPSPVPTASPAPAKINPKIGEVSQIFRDKKRAVVNVTDGSATSERPAKAVISFSNGEACEGTVVQSDLTKMLIEFTDCSTFDKVKTGMAVSPPAFEVQAVEKVAAPAEAPVVRETPKSEPEIVPSARAHRPERRHRVRVSLGTGYHTGTSLKFDSATIKSGTTSVTGKYEFDVESALQINIGIIMATERS